MSADPLLVRWGSSPYERPSGIELEASVAAKLGVRYRAEPQGAPATVIASADIVLVTSLTRVGALELAGAPRCRLLLTTTSGHDHLDLQAAKERGVVVARMPLARCDAVAQTALGMALAMLRDLPGLQAEAREGRWVRPDLPGRGLALLADEPIGLVGLGVIGSRLAAMLVAMGCTVLGVDPAGVPAGVEPVPLLELLQRCRVVSLHCSHQRGQPPVVGPEQLAAARADLLLINTARGGVLDLQAARTRLEEGRLGGLALDVFPVEPWPGLASLASHPRVLLTPHAAGFHPELHRAIAGELRDILEAWTAGREVPNRVD